MNLRTDLVEQSSFVAEEIVVGREQTRSFATSNTFAVVIAEETEIGSVDFLCHTPQGPLECRHVRLVENPVATTLEDLTVSVEVRHRSSMCVDERCNFNIQR